MPEIKLNTDWQIGILSKSVYMVNEIVFIVILHWVDNFWLYKKNLHFLIKQVSLFAKNVSLGDLNLKFKGIWKNRELSKLAQLVVTKEHYFTKTLELVI